MPRLARSKRIVRLHRAIGDTAYFNQTDGKTSFQMSADDWRDMGEPKELTLTIEPGDRLNMPGTEAPAGTKLAD
jgi:hypothetical protein